jgi:hypothetical protein
MRDLNLPNSLHRTLARACSSLLVAAAATALRLNAGAAQDTTAVRATVGPPIQRIATASAVSAEPILSILSVRELPDGRVLVNDGARRRLMLMDTMLKNVEVVLDSMSEIANTYGTRPGALIPYRADTTLFVDPVSLAMVVIDPQGKVTRVRSIWRAQDVTWVTNPSGQYGWPGIDAKGRIVYRVPARPAPPLVPPPRDVPYIPQQPDSAFIVAADLNTRMIDTLGAIRIPRQEQRVRRTVEGYFSFDVIINPMPTTDDWAVLPDGAVAFVRWLDYRIEYLNPDGTITSSAKLPYAWQRMLDDDKQRLVDSVKTAQQRSATFSYTNNMIRWVNLFGKGYPAGFKVPEGFILPPGLAKEWKLPEGVTVPRNYVFACPPGVEPEMRMPPANASGAARQGAQSAGPPGQPSCMPAPSFMGGGNAPPPPSLRQVSVMEPSELPDYRPPISPGSVRADLEGNLWIRTNPPRRDGTVYDVVSRQGELAARLQTPPGYNIVGFGRGKIVFLSMRDATGMHLARVRLR